jgi:membrane fusion protein (multidrug efflux system)
VQLSLGKENTVLSVPITAVNYAPYGNSVYVVERSQDESGNQLTKVRQQIVQLGQRKGDLTVIERGLAAGDEVVTSGGFKLRPDAIITINNSIVPGSAENPSVKDT